MSYSGSLGDWFLLVRVKKRVWRALVGSQQIIEHIYLNLSAIILSQQLRGFQEDKIDQKWRQPSSLLEQLIGKFKISIYAVWGSVYSVLNFSIGLSFVLRCLLIESRSASHNLKVFQGSQLVPPTSLCIITIIC